MTFDRLKKKSKPTDRKAEAVLRKDPFADLKVKRERDSHLHPDRQEMSRILSLPILEMMSAEEADAISYDRVNAEAYDSGFRLLTTQASAIDEIERANGGFLPIGVGWGKTGISVMAAQHFHQLLLDQGVHRPKGLLLIEPGAVTQFGQTDLKFWRSVVPVSAPFLQIGGKPKKARQAIYSSGYKGCYVVPYSMLSVADTMDMLEHIDPDYVIADEAHNLKAIKTARTKRFLHMMDQRPRLFVAMSGTMTTKSINDYRHLLGYALREGAPIPMNGAMAMEWGRVLDSDAEINGNHMTGPLLPLVEWAQEHDPDPKARYKMTVSDLRRAFTLRLHTAPGVVATGDNEIKASLSIVNADGKGKSYSPENTGWTATREGWHRLHELMDDVTESFITPNGDEIECSLHIFKWMIELSAGFYNERIWPTPEQICKRTDLTEREAMNALGMAKEAHADYQLLARMMRNYFDDSDDPHNATPMMLGLAISQGRIDGIPGELVELWNDHLRQINRIKEKFGYLPERYSRAVRVCDYKIEAGLRWAKEKEHGIIWVNNIEMGKWMHEALVREGLPALHCPAGANDTIQDAFNPDRGGWSDSDQLAVASIGAHCTSKNLQRAPNQLVLQWPRSSKNAEQMLGRVHRNGVEKLRDSVDVHACNILPYEHLNFAACLNDSIYQHQTGSRRKMIYASYDPLPKVFSPEFLRENVGDTKMLNAQQRQMLEAKFGEDWMDRI